MVAASPKRRAQNGAGASPTPTSLEIDAEQSVIGAAFLRGAEVLPRANLEPDDFFDRRHQLIWGAMHRLARNGKPPNDLRLIEGELGDAIKFVTLGYMSECTSVVPTADNVEHYAAVVRAHAITRRVHLVLSEVMHSGLDGEPLLRTAGERVQALLAGHRSQLEPQTLIERMWSPLDLAMLTTQPAARDWLLRHPTRDGKPAPPNGGDGLLPLGQVGMLSSAGGAGKTHTLVYLAVCIITGHPWLGHFDVDWGARKGRVFLGLAEENAAEVHRRLYTVAQHLQLTPSDRRLVAEQLVVMPLAGKPVALVRYADDGRTLVESAELAGLRRRLEAEPGDMGWSLVGLDPMARWAGGTDVESDNAMATRFVQVLETLTSAPGRPTVLVAHHSSKATRTQGTADARGVTALTDGMRWQATLRAEGGSTYFQQVKSNYSRPMDDELRLVRENDGLLRAASSEETARAEEAREAKKAQRRAEAIQRARDRIAHTIRSQGPFYSRETLLAAVGGDRNAASAALTVMLDERAVTKRSSDIGREFYDIKETPV